MWICQCSAYFKFIPSTHTCIHTHTHTRLHAHMRAYSHTHILIPFEDCEPMGIKVDIAVNLALSATFFFTLGDGGWGGGGGVNHIHLASLSCSPVLYVPSSLAAGQVQTG